MSPENIPPADGQESPLTPSDAQEASRDYEAELKDLRAEAAKWRTQLRQEQAKVKELAPAAERLAALQESQKTEEQKLRDKLAELEAAARDAETKAENAQKRVKLITLAGSIGVTAEVADLLDLSRLDLEDEEAVLETLKKLVPKNAVKGGGASNPASQPQGASDESLMKEYFNRAGVNVAKIFGG